MNKTGGGFESFLDTTFGQSFIDKNDQNRVESNVNLLIFVWLKKYIDTYNPLYDIEDVYRTIRNIEIRNNSVIFLILHPYTHTYEQMGFGINFLEESRMMTSQMVERILGNSYNSSKK